MIQVSLRIGAVLLLLCMLVGVVAASAAANTVPQTSLGSITQSIAPDSLKPPICAGINITSLASGSVAVVGNAGNTLILGSAIIDTLTGQGGDDCIVGGGGADILLGGAGDDVLIGGPGIDVCTGGPGNDTFDPSCETQIQ